MLSNAKEKLIAELHTKKGREKHGLCLVEGKKAIDAAGSAVDFTFTRDDTANFDTLVTTETPQDMAAVAAIPTWNIKNILSSSAVVVLDGVQDPGNVGAILRLCLGFAGSAVLIDSADVSSPKVVRASAGAMFDVSWLRMPREDAASFVIETGRVVYRLEPHSFGDSFELTGQDAHLFRGDIIMILGAEGKGISLDVKGTSLEIPHNRILESLNVGHAAAIAMYVHYENRNTGDGSDTVVNPFA